MPLPLLLTGPRGGTVWLDPQDHHRARNHPWRISSHGYPVARMPDGSVSYLPRWLIGSPGTIGPGFLIATRNGDRLDLRRENLVVGTKPRQVPQSYRNPSFRGVYARALGPHRWWVLLSLSKRGQVYGGDFDDELAAALAHDRLARLHGVRRLNFSS